jgi:hypothetical protein
MEIKHKNLDHTVKVKERNIEHLNNELNDKR